MAWTEIDLFAAAARRLNTAASSGGSSARLRATARALARLSSNGSREVVLELPKDIASGLVSGSLTRTGGVIRDSEGKIVLHLKDISKLKKALKGAALPLMFLDFAESALLNRKLEQIQKQVSALAEKIEAGQKAMLVLPFEKAAKLAFLTSESSRTREIKKRKERWTKLSVSRASASVAPSRESMKLIRHSRVPESKRLRARRCSSRSKKQ